jgi:hypothetical protein
MIYCKNGKNSEYCHKAQRAPGWPVATGVGPRDPRVRGSAALLLIGPLTLPLGSIEAPLPNKWSGATGGSVFSESDAGDLADLFSLAERGRDCPAGACISRFREERPVAGSQELRRLATWYREFAERAGNPWIWDA